MLTLVSPPAEWAITLAEAKGYLRLDSGDEDPLLAIYIEAAIAELDGPEGLLGRALITQTWRLTLDRFTDEIDLPLPPCQEVESVTYINAAGQETTVDPASYRVLQIGAHERARLSSLTAWPHAAYRHDAVTVQFRAGYGMTPNEVPAPIRTALLEMVADRFDFRGSVSNEKSFSSLPMSAQAALVIYRQWEF